MKFELNETVTVTGKVLDAQRWDDGTYQIILGDVVPPNPRMLDEAHAAARRVLSDADFGQLAGAIVGMTDQQRKAKMLSDLEFNIANALFKNWSK